MRWRLSCPKMFFQVSSATKYKNSGNRILTSQSESTGNHFPLIAGGPSRWQSPPVSHSIKSTSLIFLQTGKSSTSSTESQTAFQQPALAVLTSPHCTWRNNCSGSSHKSCWFQSPAPFSYVCPSHPMTPRSSETSDTRSWS